MPIISSTSLDSMNLGGGFKFSATRIEDLGASEYTLVVIAVDVSGSVSGFQNEIENCVKEVVRACGRSPRADNLMLRLVLFDNALKEYHGFLPLSQCDVDKYTGSIRPGGMTALYDASYEGVESLVHYGKSLVDNDFDANGILVVITDGMDNSSTMTPKSIKAALGKVVTDEALESMVSILVGINQGGASLSNYLQDFKDNAGFTQYVELSTADAKTLAKLADFVSKSISSQSQALGTGGPSQSLTF